MDFNKCKVVYRGDLLDECSNFDLVLDQVRLIQPNTKLDGIGSIFNRGQQEIRGHPNGITVEIDGSTDQVIPNKTQFLRLTWY